MKKLFFIAPLVTIILFITINKPAFSQNSEPIATLKKLWETPAQLTTCESVCFDAIGNVIYVSCINGNPTDKDGNGFIAKLSTKGDIINLQWITGLNAPKGMGIFKKKLYVTDIDRVVEIDIDKSVVVKEYPIEGAKFLNDITVDPNGGIYISDMATGRIHLLSKGIIETWFQDPNIESPNGLLYEDGEILIGTKNGLFSTSIEDKRTWLIVKDTGGIDGLEADGRHNYIISDWMGKIQMLNSKQDPVVLINTTEQRINAADIAFLQGANTLYVPTFSDNRVMAYEIIYK
jgi:hypothetical protein